MKIRKAGISVNASSTKIERTSFDSVKERIGKTPQGADVPMTDFLLSGKVVASLGVGGLSYATLASEGKTVGAVVNFLGDNREAEFRLPTKPGFISSSEKDMRAVNSPAILRALAEGKKFYQPTIEGWTGADFIPA
jgi:hypothetical protein